MLERFGRGSYIVKSAPPRGARLTKCLDFSNLVTPCSPQVTVNSTPLVGTGFLQYLSSKFPDTLIISPPTRHGSETCLSKVLSEKESKFSEPNQDEAHALMRAMRTSSVSTPSTANLCVQRKRTSCECKELDGHPIAHLWLGFNHLHGPQSCLSMFVWGQ